MKKGREIFYFFVLNFNVYVAFNLLPAMSLIADLGIIISYQLCPVLVLLVLILRVVPFIDLENETYLPVVRFLTFIFL